MTGNPTMNDVAREAGVALKTVSRFVNGERNINPALAGRIADAIDTLGYRRNLTAASIRPGWTTKTIGLIISDLANPYYSTLTGAIESYARERGFLVISSSSDESGPLHDRLVDRLLQQRVDALIVVPPGKPGRPWSEVTPPVPPVVFVDRPAEFEHADVIISDNLGGATAATAELLDHGATRVAFVGDALNIYTVRERHAGYLAALAERGIAVDQALVRTDAHTSEQAATAVAELLAVTDADAVFAANNRASVGALLAFRIAGRRLPIIGFDDFEAAMVSSPPVSVVSQDIAELGRRAAETALNRVDGTQEQRGTTVLPTRLVLRGSERS